MIKLCFSSWLQLQLFPTFWMIGNMQLSATERVATAEKLHCDTTTSGTSIKPAITISFCLMYEFAHLK